MIIVESLSFRESEFESMILLQTSNMNTEKYVSERATSPKIHDIGDQIPILDSSCEVNPHSSLLEPENRRNLAALKLQKVYKSFRTRRQLADCAVLVEQRWWKLLDFAELRRSSISFFDIDKTETAASRWYRARTRAAKVGKGLSKDAKARKLALQHWLEAIDPRHRYGHNLHFYYAKWLHCDSNQPFFYWLDIGEGKEVNLERCTRSKLQQQCIKYLGPTERTHYEVTFQDGKFIYKSSGELLDTRACKDAKWIFVLSTTKILYVGKKSKGTFQHSSFLAGGATLSAGRLEVEDGILKAVWPHSGHYLPTEENFQAFMSFLLKQKVDLTDVKTNSIEEDEVKENKKNFEGSVKNSESENVDDQENSGTSSQDTDGTAQNNVPLISRLPPRLCTKITKLEIPKRNDVLDTLKKELIAPWVHEDLSDSESEDGYETAEESFLTEEDFMISKVNLFDHDNQEEELSSPITKEEITRRIKSHKLMKSYQLAQQLSSKWTTGAGPRIGCMRDYPSELQFRVLEQANLSPRSKCLRSSLKTLSRFNPSVLTPNSLCKLDKEPK